MTVAKFLDLSSSHLPLVEREQLPITESNQPGAEPFPVRVIPHEYGWWINVPGEDDPDALPALKERGLHRLSGLLQRAKVEGCWWVNLDQDGGLEDGLERFNESFRSPTRKGAIPVATVTCSICGNECSAALVHTHQGRWIGDECCWDERLRASE